MSMWDKQLLVGVRAGERVADLRRERTVSVCGRKHVRGAAQLTFWVVDFSSCGWTAEATESMAPLT